MSRRKFDLETKEDRKRFVQVCNAIQTAGETKAATQLKIAEAMKDSGLPLNRGNLSGWLTSLNKACRAFSETLVDAFRQVPGGWDVSPAARGLCRLWDAQILEEDTLLGDIAKLIRHGSRQRGFVTIAAGETVKSYLLPHVARLLNGTTPPLEIRLVDFHSPASFSLLEADFIDAVLAWDVPKRYDELLDAEAIAGTDSLPVAVIAPTHPLASVPRAKEVGTDTVRNYPLVHPDVPHLAQVIERLESLKNVPVSVLPLPSIGYYVVTTSAVGIVPDWPWIRRDLRRRFGVEFLPLAQKVLKGLSADTQLRLVTRKTPTDRTLALRAAIAQAVEGLSVRSWESVDKQLTTGLLEGEWHFYYITFGPDGLNPRASWCISRLHLERTEGRDATLAGQLHLGPPFETKKWVLDAKAEVVPFGQGMLLLRTYKQDDREPGSTLFREWLRRPGAEDDVLVGINTCVSITGTITASPAVLSRNELGELDREALLRQEVVTLLSPNLANEPIVTPTKDYRR